MFNATQSNGTLHLDNLKCLRAAYLYNTCSLCAQICPANALALANNQRFVLDTQKCIDCNACVGVCPTEAIATKSFDTHSPLPVYRQLLSNSLKKQIESIPTQRVQRAFSFTQNKTIAFERYNNGGDCGQFCPTHTLHYSDDHTKILFANTQCIACGICDDICKPKAFGAKEELDVVSMAFGRFETLIEHHFEICSKCKVSFPHKNKKTVCNRCRDFVKQNASLFVMARDM